jgi:hypothetical protein
MATKMMIRGPEAFYSVDFRDDIGFFPVADLLDWPDDEEWSSFKYLQWEMGRWPRSFTILRGYGIFIEHEDFWVFGKTPGEVRAVADEWPEED